MPPLIIAHRGASGHAHQNSPEAFRAAVRLGAEGVELDIHATTDGALLVHHDPEVEGVGVIAERRRADFDSYRLPNGEAIASLDAVLPLLDGLDVWVEVKTLPSRFDQVLLETLDRGPTPRRYAVHAFDHRIIARLGNERPELRRGVLLASYLLDTLPILRGVGADSLWMEAPLIDAALVKDLHEDGREIIAWTANDPRQIERLVDLGVDGICGNYPERIREAISRPRRARTVPPQRPSSRDPE